MNIHVQFLNNILKKYIYIARYDITEFAYKHCAPNINKIEPLN